MLDRILSGLGIQTTNTRETELWNKGICLECNTPYEHFANHGYELSRATVYKCGCSEEHLMTITGDADTKYPPAPVPELTLKVRSLLAHTLGLGMRMHCKVVLKDALAEIDALKCTRPKGTLSYIDFDKTNDNVVLSHRLYLHCNRSDILIHPLFWVSSNTSVVHIKVQRTNSEQRKRVLEEFTINHIDIDENSKLYRESLVRAVDLFILELR